jgi:30S ribosomal protein S31
MRLFCLFPWPSPLNPGEIQPKPLYLHRYLFYYISNQIRIMGRGDKKTAKGKRFKGSFGKSRPAKTKKAAVKKSSK